MDNYPMFTALYIPYSTHCLYPSRMPLFIGILTSETSQCWLNVIYPSHGYTLHMHYPSHALLFTCACTTLHVTLSFGAGSIKTTIGTKSLCAGAASKCILLDGRHQDNCIQMLQQLTATSAQSVSAAPRSVQAAVLPDD